MVTSLDDNFPISFIPAISAVAVTWPISGDRGEDFEAPGEDGIVVDLTFDFGFEVGDGIVEGAQLPLQLGDRRRLACADLVDNSGSIIDEALPASRQFLNFFDDFGGKGDGVGGWFSP